MSFLDSIKTSVKNYQDKSATLKADRGKKLGYLTAVKYVGGYDADTKPSRGLLMLFENRVEYKAGRRSITIPSELVTELAVEGKDEVSRRVTATRLLTIGLFAFAAKKKSEDKEAFITVALKDGRQVVFHKTETSPLQLKPKLAGASSYYGRRSFSRPQ